MIKWRWVQHFGGAGIIGVLGKLKVADRLVLYAILYILYVVQDKAL